MQISSIVAFIGNHNNLERYAKMDMKKVMSYALCAIVISLLLIVSGCGYSEEEVNAAIDAATAEAISQANADSQIAIDALAAEVDAANAEIANLTAVEEEIVAVEALLDSAYEIDDLSLGDNVRINIDDNDLDKLLDTKVEFDGEDYDVEELFEGVDADIVIAYNGDDSYDEDFDASPYLVLADKGALVYSYVFNDEIDYTDISDDTPLEISLLGIDLKIVALDDDEMTVEGGDRIMLDIAQPQMYNEIELKLLGVNDDEAYISYNGEALLIEEGDSDTIGGLEIKVVEVFDSDNFKVAKIVVGTDVDYVLEDDDSFFDDESFVFNIIVDGDELSGFTVTYDERAIELDDDFTPLAVGDKIVFPNSYITVEFKEITAVDYIGCKVSFDDFDTDNNSIGASGYLDAVVLECDDSIIIVDGDDEFDTVYFTESDGIWYEDEDGDMVVASTIEIVNDDYELEVVLNSGSLEISSGLDFTISLDTIIADASLGIEDDAESTDVVYDGDEVGTFENNLLTVNGLIIEDIENNAEADKVIFKVPSENVEATVIVY